MKQTTIIFFTLIFSAMTVFGADAKKEDTFWVTTQSKVQKLKLTSKKSNPAAATIAGVKGAKNDRTDIYWKGKEKKVEISEDELQKFIISMELQSCGEKAKSLKQFEAFILEFPESPLHEEGMKAVQILKNELNLQQPVSADPLPVVLNPQALPTAPQPAIIVPPPSAPAISSNPESAVTPASR